MSMGVLDVPCLQKCHFIIAGFVFRCEMMLEESLENRDLLADDLRTPLKCPPYHHAPKASPYDRVRKKQ